MPEYTFRLTCVFQTLENDTQLAEALFFPEVSRFGEGAKKLEAALKENAARIIEEAASFTLSRRHHTGPVEAGEVRLVINPPPRSVAWRSPVELRFDVVRFAHGDDARIAFIPALGIEVVARNTEELSERLPAEIHAHLLRLKKASSLGKLVWLQRARELTLVESSFAATVRTPKQVAMSLDAESEEKPELERVAIDLAKERLPQAFEMDDTVALLADALTGRRPRSVLLVGKSGVGKTAAFYELVRRRSEFRLARTPFFATSGARLVAGMSGFGMWQERCGKVWREAAKRKAVLHFGNLLELMEVGKSASSDQGVAAFFRPYISRGDLLCLVECTPEQLPVIERQSPNLLDAFLQLNVAEPSPERGATILLNYVASQSQKGASPIDLEGVETLDRLHRRYATYSAYPGRPLRFLKNLLQDREGKMLTAADVTARFSAETGLPLFLLDDDTPLDLRAAQEWFARRVIGQAEAVTLVVDLLATVKTKLTRAGKPIASLLFIGPTGVGKTELAKSLAEFLFRARERMVRFDMSEYADPVAVSRLIGGGWGEEGLLTSKVREQPFAVILLDEFEKAHPSCFDLLLQVLGEGRLTDSMGRVADFTNAVVIMTSNLGAETYKRNALGFRDGEDAAANAREHFLKEVRAFVRPEFFNRLDRVVPFAPLDEATVLEIARRELERVNRRDGVLHRGVEIIVTDDVARHLARRGYDARYGARPLKRAIERDLLVPLAEALNAQPADVVVRADVRVEGERLIVAAGAKIDEAGRVVSKTMRSAPFAELVKEAAMLRRDAQNLQGSAAALDTRNEIFNLLRLEKRLARRKWRDPEQAVALARLPELQGGVRALDELVNAVAMFEDEILLSFYGKEPSDKETMQARLSELTRKWEETLLRMYGLQFKKPNSVTLAVYGENAGWLFELARWYHDLAVALSATIEIFEFATPSAQETAAIRDAIKAGEKVEVFSLFDRVTVKRKVEKPKEFFAAPQNKTVGIVFDIKCQLAYPMLESERDLHSLVGEKQTHRCLAHTSEAPAVEYTPPAGLEKRGGLSHLEKRRAYNREESFVEDFLLKEKLYLDRDDPTRVLRFAVERQLLKAAREMLGE